jgi:hypothetical protein
MAFKSNDVYKVKKPFQDPGRMALSLSLAISKVKLAMMFVAEKISSSGPIQPNGSLSL